MLPTVIATTSAARAILRIIPPKSAFQREMVSEKCIEGNRRFLVAVLTCRWRQNGVPTGV